MTPPPSVNRLFQVFWRVKDRGGRQVHAIPGGSGGGAPRGAAGGHRGPPHGGRGAAAAQLAGHRPRGVGPGEGAVPQPGADGGVRPAGGERHPDPGGWGAGGVCSPRMGPRAACQACLFHLRGKAWYVRMRVCWETDPKEAS